MSKKKVEDKNEHKSALDYLTELDNMLSKSKTKKVTWVGK